MRKLKGLWATGLLCLLLACVFTAVVAVAMAEPARS